MPARKIMRIELTSSSKQRLGKITDRHGITQVAMLSRLVEWFATVDPTLQGAILDQFPESISADIARLVLEKIASDSNST